MVDFVQTAMASGNQTPEEKAAHDAAMVAAANKGATTISGKDADGVVTLTQQAAAKPARPADIPEKFWDSEKGEVNVAALLKSQQDGEAALRGKTPQTAPSPAPSETPEGGTPAQSNAISAASAEFEKDGVLSDETYTKLDAVGLSKGMVQEYIAGKQAIIASLEAAAYSPFEGNPDNYNTAANWAAENLSDDEIAALDVQLTSTNPAIIKAGATALQAKYAAAADIEPTTVIHGDGNLGSTGSYFKSGAEMRAAMANPKYKLDESYRQEVAGKIKRAPKTSNLFG